MTKNNIPYYFLFTLLTLLLFTSGCQKDIIGEETDTEIITQGPLISIESTVYGLVSDINGNPLPGVSVEHRGDTYLSDANGYFIFNSASSQTNGGYLSFKKDNYFNNYKFFNPIEVGDLNFIRITMIDQNLSKALSSNAGGQVSTNGGATIDFEANSFAKSDGSAYVGNVNVYAHWYDPTSNQLAETMPGDLRGTDLGGARVQLATYGMMGVELRDDAGNALNLAAGKTATLTFPLPESLQTAAPDTIPTWSYDEERGYWREEGQATLVNNKYIAEVSHFSFWNIDAKFPVVKFRVTVVSESEVALPNIAVYLKIVSSGVTSTGVTNQDGSVCGLIPSDEKLLLYVYDDCREVAYSEEIGPFSDETDIGNIIINLNNLITVEGQLTCGGSPVTNGYALLTTNDGVKYAIPVDNNGDYSTELIFCSDLKVTLEGVDIDEGKQADPEIFTNPANPLVIDQEVCDDSASIEFISYDINGTSIFIENPSAKIENGLLTINGSLGESGLRMRFRDPITGNNLPIDSLYAIAFGQVSSDFVWCYNETSTPCDATGGSITELGTSVGEYVIGSFESEVNPGKILRGSFRIIIDEILNYNTLQVTFWNDDNGDGLQAADEGLWSLSSGPQPTVELIPANTATLDTDFGEHIYTGLDAGTYQLRVLPPTGYAITMKMTDGNNIDEVTNLSDEIIFNTTGELESIKVGFKPTLNAECYYELREPASCSQEGLVSIHINNTDLLTYNLFTDGDLIESNTFSGGEFELWLEGDRTYTYEILDTTNNVLCTETFLLDQESSSCMFYPIELCENGVPYVITEWDCNNISPNASDFLWSDGSTEAIPEFTAEGTYSVTVTDLNGCTATGELEVNFQEFKSISGFAWVDNPMFNDNVADNGDDRFEGLVVNLFDASGGFIESTVSDVGGIYQFGNLSDGDYYIETELPTGYIYLEANAGINDFLDSDIDPDTGRSELITIGDCNTNNDISIGLKEQ